MDSVVNAFKLWGERLSFSLNPRSSLVRPDVERRIQQVSLPAVQSSNSSLISPSLKRSPTQSISIGGELLFEIQTPIEQIEDYYLDKLNLDGKYEFLNEQEVLKIWKTAKSRDLQKVLERCEQLISFSIQIRFQKSIELQEYLKQLKKYDIVLNSLSIKGTSRITDESNVPLIFEYQSNITSLTLSDLYLLSSDTGNYIRKLTFLKELSLLDCHNLNNYFIDLIRSLPQLKYLLVKGCPEITQEGLDKLNDPYNPDLPGNVIISYTPYL